MSTIVKPVITEKMTKMTDELNRYAFITAKKATKKEIKKAVEGMYDVSVLAVNTMIIPAKKRSRFTRSGVLAGRTQAYKKAIVTLAEGDIIDFYSEI